MPKRKRSTVAIKRRLKRRRRIYRIKRKIRKSRNLILGGFPKSKMVKLRYVTEITLDPAANLYQVHHFRANSLFDPDYTGIGHQPSNFDRWMNIYNHYTVVGSKITAKYMPTAAPSGSTGSYFGIMLTDDYKTIGNVFTSGGVANIMEQRLNTSSRFVAGAHVLAHPCTVVKRFSAKKFFGKKDQVMDGLYRGDASSNPQENAFFSVYTMSVGGNDPALINVLIKIDYIAVLTEPKESDAS